MHTATTRRELAHYFEHSWMGLELDSDGLVEMPFGEYLVEQQALNREQLFEALSEQDWQPDVPLGEIVAALGYVPYAEVDILLEQYLAVDVVEVD